jgi:uncharacterized protein with LGFP repeats
MPEAIAVTGKIAERWMTWGGADGPFGPPVAAEEFIPGHAGSRQRFQRGEIAWSPNEQCLTSVYALRTDACFEWSRPGFDYDYFRYNINKDDVGLGQADFKGHPRRVR